jgi:cytoskeletal protein RodZ
MEQEMGFWKNTHTSNRVLPEVDEYYAGEQRSAWAWVLALIALLIAVLFLLSLFWGGKWLYGKVTDNNDEPTVAISTPNEQKAVSNGKTDASGDSSTTTPVVTPDTSDQSSPAPNTTTPSTTPSANPTPTTTPKTGIGNLAPIFVLVSLLSASVRSSYLRRRNDTVQ